MKIYRYLFLLFIIASCNAPQAVYDYDQEVAFSQLTTYQIYPDLVTNLNQLDEKRILAILNEELSDKGLVSSENPQILVNFFAEEYEAESGNSLGLGVGGSGGNVGVGVSGGIPIGGVDTYLRLTFDFIDATKDSLIWQAVVEGKFEKDTTPQNREARLRAFVEKALEGYPPQQ